eukprot:NODE_607_length_1923_cov_20.313767_g486_i0.p2 GENE.NODE_607_length_1923_cov_20.313767_g486_i0~~NODE_607_length_1923_cov_20.313767_g486_i0.p2  ORF type:complete len:293 (+),score=80.37 NODE_607_length_1923_cov_20.313767_g486_i0:998-1876(+)
MGDLEASASPNPGGIKADIVRPEDKMVTGTSGGGAAFDGKMREWYCGWQSIKTIMDPMLSSSKKILILGCGSSSLGPDLYELGYTKITNIDADDAVIAFMRNKYSEMKEMQWRKMDAGTISFDDASFDVVIDKAFTDDILTQDDAFPLLHKVYGHVSRILKDGGRFICFSHGPPETRLDHFQMLGYPYRRREKLHWKFECIPLPLDVFVTDGSPAAIYFAYTNTKREGKGTDADHHDSEGDSDSDDDRFYKQMGKSLHIDVETCEATTEINISLALGYTETTEVDDDSEEED